MYVHMYMYITTGREGWRACMGQALSTAMLSQMANQSNVSAENLRSSSPSPLTDNYPATRVHGQDSSPSSVSNHKSEASTLTTSEGKNATEATDVGGPRAGSSTENLTGAVPVVSEHQLESPSSNRDDEVNTHSLVTETPVAGPVGNLGEKGTQPIQRRPSVQLSLTSFSQPPTQPQLPNLALAALQRLAENDPDKDDSVDDFRPLKKRKLAPEAEKDSEDGEEGQTCSICFEPWSNSGGHRIASLKCGHLFGLNCIEKWLKGQGGGKCPQCNAKAKKADIRVIFAKTISVVDTTERDRAIQERDEEKAQRMTTQKAEAQAILQYQLARAECERLKDRLKQLEAQGVKPSKSGSTSEENFSSGQVSSSRDDNASYVPYKTLSVAPQGGARVIAHDPNLGMLVVSKPICNHLLPGYGLVKYSSLELGRGEYVAAHAGVIRDAVFSPQGNGLVLTAGMDKTCRLTSMHSNLNVVTYKTSSPVWACAWNVDHPNYMYAGLNGSICVYDVRNTAECVSHLRTEGVQVPITSLSYVPLCQVSTLNVGGLLAGTLNGGVFWERDNHKDSFTPHPLTAIPGNCTCLSFEPITRHCMASFRPSKRPSGSPHSTHVLCQLSNVPRDQPFSCRPIHQFTGGTSHRLLSRSRLFQRPGNDGRILAAFGNEEEKSVHIWNASSMKKLQTLHSLQGSALDITPFSCNEKDFLAVLSETTLSVFHWEQQSITA